MRDPDSGPGHDVFEMANPGISERPIRQRESEPDKATTTVFRMNETGSPRAEGSERVGAEGGNAEFQNSPRDRDAVRDAEQEHNRFSDPLIGGDRFGL